MGIKYLKKRLEKYKTENSNTKLFNPLIQLLELNDFSTIYKNFNEKLYELRNKLKNIDDECFHPIQTFVNSDLMYC